MTKKDYVLIASAILPLFGEQRLDKETIVTIVERLANKLAIDNPKFNAKKFALACGYGIAV